MSLNTTPRTWAAGETVTAAMLNQEIRDAMAAIQSSWTAYTPTWTASTTNPVLGNGTFNCAYLQIGKTVHFRIVLTMGSTTTYGAGQWRLTLPFTPTVNARFSFLADYLDTGNAAYTGSAAWDGTSGTLTFNAPPTTAGAANRAVGASVPFAWGSGDVLTVTGTYEAS